ncbi:hypothetical protein ACOBQJ_02440 [Pelotomaculum propionicicum]|uniref:hypothetical protein n=1 Tax=Pelotomaculum propionicicum TaxID=258475 RepID=UPI003B783E06
MAGDKKDAIDLYINQEQRLKEASNYPGYDIPFWDLSENEIFKDVISSFISDIYIDQMKEFIYAGKSPSKLISLLGPLGFATEVCETSNDIAKMVEYSDVKYYGDYEKGKEFAGLFMKTAMFKPLGMYLTKRIRIPFLSTVLQHGIEQVGYKFGKYVYDHPAFPPEAAIGSESLPNGLEWEDLLKLPAPVYSLSWNKEDLLNQETFRSLSPNMEELLNEEYLKSLSPNTEELLQPYVLPPEEAMGDEQAFRSLSPNIEELLNQETFRSLTFDNETLGDEEIFRSTLQPESDHGDQYTEQEVNNQNVTVNIAVEGQGDENGIVNKLVARLGEVFENMNTSGFGVV